MAPPGIPIHAESAARIVPYAGFQLREDTAFTNHKGQEKKGVCKQTEKLLEKLGDIAGKVLEPDEVILYVARAQAPASALEQLAFGWYVYYVTGIVLVFTNRRFLHFLVQRNGEWKKGLRSARWADVTEAKVKGRMLSPTLQLRYHDGRKETYWGLRKRDAKKLRVLLPPLLSASTGEVSVAQGMAALCPKCLATLTPHVYRCGQCGLTFKDEKTLIKRSLLIPGGGYFYAGYWLLGVGDFFVEIYLLMVVLVGAGVATEPSTEDPWAAWVLTGMFAFLLGAEKYFTIRHCRRFIRDFIPIR